MSSAVRTMRNGKVLEITLDRPKVNAIDRATSVALGNAFVAFRDDPDLLVAIVTAAGERIFSAGWDLKAAAFEGENESQDFGPGGFAGLTELFDLNKPVIAAVNGRAIGGGFELVLACDLVVAAAHADFSLPEARVGVVADAGGVQRLPRRLPYALAMELLLTGRSLMAEEALHHGLINAVVPADGVLPEARRLAEIIADGAPLTIQATKELVQGLAGMTVPEAFRSTRERRFPVHARMLESEDHEEGPRAFAEGREPVWKGR
jgi:crotonobetainyl-CoA hydratase